MPHPRSRFLERSVLNDLKWSPSVGIYGLRQAGKTSLLEKVCELHDGSYVTLDSEASLNSARDVPLQFCSHEKLFCIDEAQKAPELFPAMKQIIGTKRKPGRFLLTGSVRFTLRKDIREALTGRILLHELLPFNIAEAHELPLSGFLESFFNNPELKTLNSIANASRFGKNGLEARHLTAQLQGGGLPIPCFARDREKQDRWFRAYFETLLSRDLPLIDEGLASITLRQGFSFLHSLAQRQGQETSMTDLASQSSIRLALVKRLLNGLEALCLIEWIPAESRARKSMHKQRLEWKDAGLWRSALGAAANDLLSSEQAMQLLLSGEFRAQTNATAQPIQWNYYKSRDGAQIPWIFRKGNHAVAFTSVPLEAPKPYDYRSLSRFAQSHANHHGIVIGSAHAPVTVMGPRLFLIPHTLLF